MRRSWLSRMSPCEFHDTPRVVTRVDQRREHAVEQIAAVLRRILLRADEARDNLPAYTVYPVKVDDLAVVLVCAAVIILSLVIQEDIAILDVFRLKLELHRTLLELGEGEVGHVLPWFDVALEYLSSRSDAFSQVVQKPS